MASSDAIEAIIMNYLHYGVDVKADDAIQVTLDHTANVMVMDPVNYMHYQSKQQFRYYGGYVKSSPYNIRPPRAGNWHVVIDLGG